MFTKEEKPIMFQRVSNEWLFNRRYSDNEYVNNPNFTLKTFVIEELEEFLRQYEAGFYYYNKQKNIVPIEAEDHFEFKSAYKKIEGLIKFIQKQHKIWRNHIPEESQIQLRSLYKDTLLFELFLKFLLPETTDELSKLIEKLNNKFKKEKEKNAQIDEYWANWEGVFPGGKYILGLSQIKDDFLLEIYKSTTLSSLPLKLSKIKDNLKIKVNSKNFQDLKLLTELSNLHFNLVSLAKQIEVIDKILLDFENNGKKLISKKMLISQDFWNQHQISHYGAAINSVDQLETLIFNYVNRLGIDALLKVTKISPIKSKEDFNQDFFVLLNLAIKDQDGNVLIRKMPTGPQLEPLKTIRQGRQESLDFYLRPEPIFKKENNQASREELISRIKNDASWINKNFHKIKKAKFPQYQKNIEYIESNALRVLSKEIETWNMRTLTKAANLLDEHIIRVKSYITRSGGSY